MTSKMILGAVALVTAAGAAGVAGPLATPAAASTVSFVVTTQGPCDVPQGQVILGGSSWESGVPNMNVYSNLADGTCANASVAGTEAYGLEWQCTEFAVRWAAEAWGVSPAAWKRSGFFVDAEQMFNQAASIPGLTPIANGAAPPRPGDILVFADNTVGHVAVITGMSGGYLYFVGQNQGEAEQRIPMQNGQAISNTAASNWLRQPGSVLGWIHTGQTSSNAVMPRPGTLYNPATGLEEAYYRGANGNLWETYFANGTEHTQDLGVSMSAS